MRRQAELQATLSTIWTTPALCGGEPGRALITVCVAASVELLTRCGDNVTSRMLQHGSLQVRTRLRVTGDPSAYAHAFAAPQPSGALFTP